MLKLRRLIPRHIRETSPEKRSKFINDHISMKRGKEENAECSAGGVMQPPIPAVEEEVIELAVPVNPAQKIKVASTAVYDIVGKLSKLRRRQLQKFRRSIFGIFLDIPKHKFQGQVARCLFEREVIQPNPNEFWVEVGGSVLKFSIHEFALVTGLKCTGSLEDFVYDSDMPCALMSRFFPGRIYSVKRSELISCFENTDCEAVNDDDAVKMATLYFIHAYILSNIDNYSISKFHFQLVDDGRWVDYPWGLLSFSETIKSYYRRLVSDPSIKFMRMNGMPYAVIVWFYECCSAVDEDIVKKGSCRSPRLLNWRVISEKPMVKNLRDGISKFVYTNISANSKERDTLILPPRVNPVPQTQQHTVVEEDIQLDGAIPTSEDVHAPTEVVDSGFDDFSNPPQGGFVKGLHNQASSSIIPPKKKRKSSIPPHSPQEFHTEIPVEQRPLSGAAPAAESEKEQHHFVVPPEIRSYIHDYVDKKFEELQSIIARNHSEIMNSHNDLMNAISHLVPGFAKENEGIPHHSSDHDDHSSEDENHDDQDIHDHPSSGLDNESLHEVIIRIEDFHEHTQPRNVDDPSPGNAEKSFEGEHKDTNEVTEQSSGLEVPLHVEEVSQTLHDPSQMAMIVHPDFPMTNTQFYLPDQLLPTDIPIARIGLISESSTTAPHPSLGTRNRQPSSILKSPYLQQFDSGSKGKQPMSSSEVKLLRYPFEGHPIVGPDYPDVLFTEFSKWIQDGLLKYHRRKIGYDERYTKKFAKIKPRLDFVVVSPEDKTWFYLMSQQNGCWNDSHVDVVFYYLRKKAKLMMDRSFRYTTANCLFRAFVSSCKQTYDTEAANPDISSQAFRSMVERNARRENYINAVIQGFRIPAGIPWHLVDQVFIPVNCRNSFHWVLAVVDLKERMIIVYDSMMPRGDLSVYDEVKHLAVMLPSIFESTGFIQKTERTDWSKLESWRGKSQLDAFNVKFCDGIAQQPSGSLDCGLFMCAYAEFLSDQVPIPPVFIDVDLHRTRYGALLWDYGIRKVNHGYVSDNDDPKYPRQHFDIPDGDDLVDLTSP